MNESVIALRETQIEALECIFRGRDSAGSVNECWSYGTYDQDISKSGLSAMIQAPNHLVGVSAVFRLQQELVMAQVIFSRLAYPLILSSLSILFCIPSCR